MSGEPISRRQFGLAVGAGVGGVTSIPLRAADGETVRDEDGLLRFPVQRVFEQIVDDPENLETPGGMRPHLGGPVDHLPLWKCSTAP